MTVSLFTFVDLYRRQLDSLSHLLTKGTDHAAANGIAERDMLGWRLTEDMFPLGFQAMVVINFAQQWTARAAGVDVPEGIGADLDMAGFQAAIVEAKAFLATLTPEQFAGRDDVPLTVRITDALEPTMPAAQWLTLFGTTNLYFHLSMVYALLRTNGVPVGKPDLFGGGL
ncbi:MAG: DUF1993 domain-containing protein [Sphingomonas sp.]